MPPIPQALIDCSVYFYPSETSANEGKETGGSGFLAHFKSKHEGFVHLYAITNKHVIDGGCRVLRLNTIDGKTDTIASEPSSWTFHPDGDDVAVMPVSRLDKKFRWYSIDVARFLSTETLQDYDLRPGDETFLVGRLVTAGGKQKNTPVVRFGNLSMLCDPDEPVNLGTGSDQIAFLVECRSLSGFSGSPVFVQTTRDYVQTRIPKAERLKPVPPPTDGKSFATFTPISISGTFGPWLLGIDCAHIPLWTPVYERDKETKTKYQVEANTGIACVVPAWKILEMLNEKDFVRARTKDDEEIAKLKVNGVVADVAEEI